MKRCNKCGEVKPPESYRRTARSWEACRACEVARCKAYRQAHKEEIKARRQGYKEVVNARRRAAYRQEEKVEARKRAAALVTPEQKRAKRRDKYLRAIANGLPARRRARWHADSAIPEKLEARRAQTRAYYRQHREQIIAAGMRWREANPDKVKEHARKRAATVRRADVAHGLKKQMLLPSVALVPETMIEAKHAWLLLCRLLKERKKGNEPTKNENTG